MSVFKNITSDSANISNLSFPTRINVSNLPLASGPGQFIRSDGSNVPAFTSLAASHIPAGSNNQALMTRAGVSQYSDILPSDITTGNANEFLVKNSLGTATVFTNNPVCPGNMTINGTTNMVGNVQLNGANGSAGQIIKKVNPSSQSWQNIVPSDITGGANEQSLFVLGSTLGFQNRSWKFGIIKTNFLAQNWNASELTNLTFAAPTILNSLSYGTNGFTNISVQTPNTSLLINSTGHYMISMYCCLSNGGVGTASVRFDTLVNGFITGGGPLVTISVGQNQCISCSYPILLSAGAVVSFAAERISGTSSLTADATNSSLSITLLQTLG